MNNSDGENSILRELHQRIEFAQRTGVGNVQVEKAVLEYGQSFVGTNLPKGFRKRKERNCFGNAGDLALSRRGVYVEGFAVVASFPLTHHAWITLDGFHAIDVTWRADARDCYYFGIPFSLRVLERWIARRCQTNGNCWGPLFDWLQAPFDDLLKDILSDPAQVRNVEHALEARP